MCAKYRYRANSRNIFQRVFTFLINVLMPDLFAMEYGNKLQQFWLIVLDVIKARGCAARYLETHFEQYEPFSYRKCEGPITLYVVKVCFVF